MLLPARLDQEVIRLEPDHYAVLQVDPRAEREVIDAAYRRLATKYHPDRNRSADAHSRMTLINAAYDVLSDPEKRVAYDRRRGLSSGGWIPPGPVGGGQIISWRTIVMVLAVVLLMIVALRVPAALRLLLPMVVFFFIAWALSNLRTPR
jgi:preprotein translocase subunit Sec63